MKRVDLPGCGRVLAEFPRSEGGQNFKIVDLREVYRVIVEAGR